MMWDQIVIFLLLITGFLHAQKKHYEFLESQKKRTDLSHYAKHLDLKIEALEISKKDFEEYKKRVDSLTLRAGFKL